MQQLMEAVSFKKCDGQAECDKTKPADSAEAFVAAALESCSNFPLDVTKYELITAEYNGEALVGGVNAEAKSDPAGADFCENNCSDLNQCD